MNGRLKYKRIIRQIERLADNPAVTSAGINQINKSEEKGYSILRYHLFDDGVF
ncbi:hypothetical protein [Peribacillus butanolivorans]